MKSFRNISAQNAGLPLVADDVLEFHAARLLLLFRFCGTRRQGTNQYRIEGLTKMAKLDFFVRYPTFFHASLGTSTQPHAELPESPMIRFQYGPWDDRYYHILGYLTAKGLLAAAREGNTVVLTLTDLGTHTADQLVHQPGFDTLVPQVQEVARAYKQKSGNALKKLIYAEFDKEITALPWGAKIDA